MLPHTGKAEENWLYKARGIGRGQVDFDFFGMNVRGHLNEKSNSIFILKEKIIHTCAVAMKSSSNIRYYHNIYCLLHMMSLTAHSNSSNTALHCIMDNTIALRDKQHSLLEKDN